MVDPEEPMRASDWLDSISSTVNGVIDSLTFGLAPTLRYEYHSKYHGDGHSGYAGAYRAMTAIEFDWDGTTISGVRPDGDHYGTTIRYYNYRAWLDTLFGNVEITSGSGSASDTATSATSQSASGSGFSLVINSTNPLLMSPSALTPGIDANYNGTMAGGTVSIPYVTDLFPNHGVEVKKNGAVIKTQVVNDASGVNAMGVAGAAALMYRLSSHSNTGTVTV